MKRKENGDIQADAEGVLEEDLEEMSELEKEGKKEKF